MKLMRRLVVKSLKFNIHFHSEHILSFLNIAPDLMSSLQIAYMEMEETLVAHALLLL